MECTEVKHYNIVLASGQSSCLCVLAVYKARCGHIPQSFLPWRNTTPEEEAEIQAFYAGMSQN